MAQYAVSIVALSLYILLFEMILIKPQGSKIGPFGFKLYTKPLAAIAQKYGVSLHLYADDTQLYIPFDPQNSKFAMKQMEACIAEIKSWMAINFLKLNDEKTEFIMLGTQHDIMSVSEKIVSVGYEEVLPSRDSAEHWCHV